MVGVYPDCCCSHVVCFATIRLRHLATAEVSPTRPTPRHATPDDFDLDNPVGAAVYATCAAFWEWMRGIRQDPFDIFVYENDMSTDNIKFREIIKSNVLELAGVTDTMKEGRRGRGAARHHDIHCQVLPAAPDHLQAPP